MVATKTPPGRRTRLISATCKNIAVKLQGEQAEEVNINTVGAWTLKCYQMSVVNLTQAGIHMKSS